MKYNIGKFLIIFLFLIFPKYEIINAKTNEEIFLGNKDAKVTIIEYASMTCIHCANFHKNIYPKIKENYIRVQGHADLVRESKSNAIINRNTCAYEKAKRRAAAAQAQRDEIRDTTREINHLKSEMHEIKNLLKELVGNPS